MARHLQSQGAIILGQNLKLGRYEIDILAKHHHTLIVCEVRARSSGTLVHPAYTIDKRKLDHLCRAFHRWEQDNKDVVYSEVRFDAAAVIVNPTTFVDSQRMQIHYYENILGFA